ncbi:CTSB [Cordylochernes scorpioides]|uniref:CTSB n=1 Tax=Cordylochernes scorpioides TaxID=51811 RepID=A0ABY6K6S6_9ARAC|nr:CTSB [Cordylochernes scorpioides]
MIIEYHLIFSVKFPISFNYEIYNTSICIQAGRNFAEDTSLDSLKNLCGVIKNNRDDIPTRYHDSEGVEIPESYDVREAWSQCKSVHLIRDQGACGSCWAHGAAEAMSDRICIASKGKIQVEVSAQDLTSCCLECGHGCNGGYPSMAWLYWQDSGLVSGGLYRGEGCKPYSLPPCNHHVPGPYKPCGETVPTPPCKKECVPGYNKTYADDKSYGKNVYGVSQDEEQIQLEILKHGSISVALDVYSDLLSYKSGVYQHHSGKRLGGHAVKMLGWGVENGVKYWLLANSWNPTWGDKGKLTYVFLINNKTS